MRAIIFDFDGVIMDSEPLHERTLRLAAESVGIALDHETFVRVCVGTADVECLKRVAREQGRELDAAEIERIVTIKRRLFAEGRKAGEVKPFGATLGLIDRTSSDERVRGMGGIAVCTGSRLAEVRAQLGALRLASGRAAIEAFSTVVTREDVTRIKPDPEPYLVAAARLGRRPEECVAIEDTPAGIRSALAAGVRVAAVCHTFAAERLRELGPHGVFETTGMSVDELLSI